MSDILPTVYAKYVTKHTEYFQPIFEISQRVEKYSTVDSTILLGGI